MQGLALRHSLQLQADAYVACGLPSFTRHGCVPVSRLWLRSTCNGLPASRSVETIIGPLSCPKYGLWTTDVTQQVINLYCSHKMPNNVGKNLHTEKAGIEHT